MRLYRLTACNLPADPEQDVHLVLRRLHCRTIREGDRDWCVVPVRVTNRGRESQWTCVQANAAADHDSVARCPVRALTHAERLKLRRCRQKRSTDVDRAVYESRRVSDLDERLRPQKWKRMSYENRKLPDIGMRIDVCCGERPETARAKSFARIERIELYPESERYSDINHWTDDVSF